MEKNKFKKIYLEITNACNLDCYFCLPLKRVLSFMSIDDFQKIIDKIKGYTDYLYLHVKGEPLLHPNLQSILDCCYENNIKVNLTTNGTLIKNNLDTLINSKAIRQLNISIHSISVFDLDKQKKYLDDVIHLIKSLENTTHYYISLRFWLGNNPLQNYAIDYLESKLDVKITIENKVIGKNIFTSFNNEFAWPEIENQKSEFVYCHGIKEHIAILVDGTVVPCCLDGNGVIKLGNIFTSSLEEILNSPRYKKMVTSFETRQTDEELCQSCTFKHRFK